MAADEDECLTSKDLQFTYNIRSDLKVDIEKAKAKRLEKEQ
jgi:hypothetical protein